MRRSRQISTRGRTTTSRRKLRTRSCVLQHVPLHLTFEVACMSHARAWHCCSSISRQRHSAAMRNAAIQTDKEANKQTPAALAVGSRGGTAPARAPLRVAMWLHLPSGRAVGPAVLHGARRLLRRVAVPRGTAACSLPCAALLCFALAVTALCASLFVDRQDVRLLNVQLVRPSYSRLPRPSSAAYASSTV